MSVIRFLHTDALRLGSPVAGLSHSPEWLRKVAAAAVRTAVTNVVEAAIAGRCQLLLIAGRLTESPCDLDLAVTWLKTQAVVLKELGIRLVIAGHPESDRAALQRLDAMFLAAGQRLDVWLNAADQVECAVSPRTVAARHGALGIEVVTHANARPLADLAYVANPAVRASAVTNSFDGAAAAHDGYLQISAGSPQAIDPAERGHFGCQLIEADPIHRTMTSRFCTTDAIRFAQELVTCRPGTPASQLCDVLQERSRSIATTGRCTTVVEWIVDGQLTLSASGTESLDETTLLNDLRSRLHAGHSGAWPCRIRFADHCRLEVSGPRPMALQEFTAVVRARLDDTERQASVSDQAAIGIPLGRGSEVALGLDLLRRVA